VFPETFNGDLPEAMSRPTSNLFNADIGASLNYSNAIITGADNTSGYFHYTGLAYMDSIGIGARRRSCYMKMFCPDVLGQNDGYVETHGINRGDLSYNPIGYMIEFYRLRHKYKKKKKKKRKKGKKNHYEIAINPIFSNY